jgi:hypothetical protein
MKINWFERMISHTRLEKCLVSGRRLQWGIVDNKLKLDPVMLYERRRVNSL